MLLLAWLLAAPAAAQPEPGANQEDAARGHFLLGRSHFEAGRFAEAAEQFQQAYDLSHRPQLLYNVFLSHRDAGNLPQAIIALRQYLAEVQDQTDRAALEQRLRTMESLQAQRGGGDTPPPDGEGGFDRTLPDPTADTGEPEGGGGPWTPGLIIAAGGGALVIGGAITGIMTLGAQSDLDERCPTIDGARRCNGDWESDRDRGQTLALVTDILLFGGIGIAAIGAVLAFTVDGGGGDAADDGTVACGPGGCSFTARF
jgi:tetratricopeptide (TPR) repeat protein